LIVIFGIDAAESGLAKGDEDRSFFELSFQHFNSSISGRYFDEVAFSAHMIFDMNVFTKFMSYISVEVLRFPAGSTLTSLYGKLASDSACFLAHVSPSSLAFWRNALFEAKIRAHSRL
jgi:hypothetical protein